MALDLTPLFFPRMREKRARMQGRRDEVNAVRSATAGAQSRGALNPAAQLRLQQQAAAEQRAASARNAIEASAADKAALVRAITGSVGTGLSMVGNAAAMGAAGSSGGGQVQSAAAQQARSRNGGRQPSVGAQQSGLMQQQRRTDEEDPMAWLEMLLNGGQAVG